MMNKTIYIQPRQTGKTTRAIFEYLKNPKSTIIVTHSQSMVQHIQSILYGFSNSLMVYKDNIITEVQFIKSRGTFKSYGTFIFDEYMFFKHKKEVYELVYQLMPNNIVAYSTSNKKYDKKTIDFIKSSKEYNTPIELTKEVTELYYNFITDPDTILHDNISSTNERCKVILHPEQYEVEIENNYLTNNRTTNKIRVKNKMMYLVIK
jgi:hypothetical protein